MSEKCCCQADGGCGLEIQSVSTALTAKDMLGAWKVRWGIGRMDYKVKPGLYSVGNPNEESPVFVSANYKLTFDMLRKNLSGVSCWLLILDTKGINVWCAAGKGTFGTDELVHRIEAVSLSSVVSHKKLIIPQLGAAGISAHEVIKCTGFSVTYGPIRARDIRKFIDTGYKATKEMRRVNFPFWDRLVLAPMELVPAVQKLIPVFGGLILANQIAVKPFDKHDIAAYTGAVIMGTVVTPALLPYVPGKAFSTKGWLLGLVFAVKHTIFIKGFKKGSRLDSAGKFLLIPAVSSYLAMNFTGSSTYTSPSGVNKEMKKSLPWIISATVFGGVLTIGAHLFGGREK